MVSAISASVVRHSAIRVVIVDRDELRKRIAANEDFSRDHWQHTTLVIRFAPSGPDDAESSGVWRFEGIAPELLTVEKDDTLSTILSELAGDSGTPPPFDLVENRNIFSWGGEGSTLEVILTVGALVPTAYTVIRDLVSRRASNADNAASGTLDADEADMLARWYLESELTGRSEWQGPSEIIDSFVRVGEGQDGNSYTFTYERDGERYRVTVDHVAGGPVIKAWERLMLSEGLPT